MLSLVPVKTIGLSAVPSAISLPPLSTTKAEANEPVPGDPFTIAPASIVRVFPDFTTTLLLRM